MKQVFISCYHFQLKVTSPLNLTKVEYSQFKLQVKDLLSQKEDSQSIKIKKPNSHKFGVQQYLTNESEDRAIKLYDCLYNMGTIDGTSHSDFYNFISIMYNEGDYEKTFELLNTASFSSDLLFGSEDQIDVILEWESRDQRWDCTPDFVGLPFDEYQ